MHERSSAARDKTISENAKASVLVVGAGPVGLTLAMDLAQRGISMTVVETRSAGEPPSVKCNHVSARSMEIFRRLGLAQMHASGVPFMIVDVPGDQAQPPGARKLILARTDQHVAWRGDEIPDGRAAEPATA
jgi:2-polyprenyl-6-methoxyphenol hydroxylase-like FAD-dependent oxidoreductase